MQQQPQQTDLFLALQAFNNLSDTERALFLGVADVHKSNNNVATKKQQKKKVLVPKEFSEEYFYSELMRTHNKSVKKRLAKLNETSGIVNPISIS